MSKTKVSSLVVHTSPVQPTIPGRLFPERENERDRDPSAQTRRENERGREWSTQTGRKYERDREQLVETGRDK